MVKLKAGDEFFVTRVPDVEPTRRLVRVGHKGTVELIENPEHQHYADEHRLYRVRIGTYTYWWSANDMASTHVEAKTVELQDARAELSRLLRILEGHYGKLVELELANFGSPPPGMDLRRQSFAKFLTTAAQFVQLKADGFPSIGLEFVVF